MDSPFQILILVKIITLHPANSSAPNAYRIKPPMTPLLPPIPSSLGSLLQKLQCSPALLVLTALCFAGVRAAAQPTISVQPASRTNNIGDNAQFTVTATGSGALTYRWQFNGVTLAGAT